MSTSTALTGRVIAACNGFVFERQKLVAAFIRHVTPSFRLLEKMGMPCRIYISHDDELGLQLHFEPTLPEGISHFVVTTNAKNLSEVKSGDTILNDIETPEDLLDYLKERLDLSARNEDYSDRALFGMASYAFKRKDQEGHAAVKDIYKALKAMEKVEGASFKCSEPKPCPHFADVVTFETSVGLLQIHKKNMAAFLGKTSICTPRSSDPLAARVIIEVYQKALALKQVPPVEYGALSRSVVEQRLVA